MWSASHQNRTQKYRNHNKIINPHINQTKQSASITEKELGIPGLHHFSSRACDAKRCIPKGTTGPCSHHVSQDLRLPSKLSRCPCVDRFQTDLSIGTAQPQVFCIGCIIHLDASTYLYSISNQMSSGEGPAQASRPQFY